MTRSGCRCSSSLRVLTGSPRHRHSSRCRVTRPASRSWRAMTSPSTVGGNGGESLEVPPHRPRNRYVQPAAATTRSARESEEFFACRPPRARSTPAQRVPGELARHRVTRCVSAHAHRCQLAAPWPGSPARERQMREPCPVGSCEGIRGRSRHHTTTGASRAGGRATPACRRAAVPRLQNQSLTGTGVASTCDLRHSGAPGLGWDVTSRRSHARPPQV